MRIETWRAIDNYPDYEVSDMGNVRRIRIPLKLTAEDVARCAELRQEGYLYREIAARFNVTPHAVIVALTYEPKRGAHRIPYRLIKPQRATTTGYLRVSLSKDGKVKIHAIHRLVAAAFLGPCPAGHEVNHKNAIRSDPRLENLEYVTHAENISHFYRVLNRKRKPYHKTHCKRGHEFTSENTYVRPRGKGRVCKACNPHAWVVRSVLSS